MMKLKQDNSTKETIQDKFRKNHKISKTKKTVEGYPRTDEMIIMCTCVGLVHIRGPDGQRECALAISLFLASSPLNPSPGVDIWQLGQRVSSEMGSPFTLSCTIFGILGGIEQGSRGHQHQ